ncbi:hypothetical protein L249_7582 [Ophiocordyceps polyrhachis-furcata BCC 54312]|uniref:Uncharacterized protein n=1 Tax=Ophiocordyceps polyrhachis-furcata BCC 54312 TaxID=1330021 RepID=A0A367L9Z9_9HYPO|nr:hypothetical protein L249_7582 [Ophiocordyceps polyrhachis-furcata BCC 54312]
MSRKMACRIRRGGEGFVVGHTPMVSFFFFTIFIFIFNFIFNFNVFIARLELGRANFPNLRRLFIEARTDDEEREFYNAVLFMASVAVFSLIAQKLNAGR